MQKKRRENLFSCCHPRIFGIPFAHSPFQIFSGLHNFLASSTTPCIYKKESKIESFTHSTEPHVYSHSALIAKKRREIVEQINGKICLLCAHWVLEWKKRRWRKKRRRTKSDMDMLIELLKNDDADITIYSSLSFRNSFRLCHFVRSLLACEL